MRVRAAARTGRVPGMRSHDRLGATAERCAHPNTTPNHNLCNLHLRRCNRAIRNNLPDSRCAARCAPLRHRGYHRPDMRNGLRIQRTDRMDFWPPEQTSRTVVDRAEPNLDCNHGMQRPADAGTGHHFRIHTKRFGGEFDRIPPSWHGRQRSRHSDCNSVPIPALGSACVWCDIACVAKGRLVEGARWGLRWPRCAVRTSRHVPDAASCDCIRRSDSHRDQRYLPAGTHIHAAPFRGASEANCAGPRANHDHRRLPAQRDRMRGLQLLVGRRVLPGWVVAVLTPPRPHTSSPHPRSSPSRPCSCPSAP